MKPLNANKNTVLLIPTLDKRIDKIIRRLSTTITKLDYYDCKEFAEEDENARQEIYSEISKTAEMANTIIQTDSSVAIKNELSILHNFKKITQKDVGTIGHEQVWNLMQIFLPSIFKSLQRFRNTLLNDAA